MISRPQHWAALYTPADLDMAQRHVEEGRQRIAEQRGRIAKLRADGHDVTLGQELLAQMLDILAGMKRHRDAIAAEMEGRARAGQP